MIGPGCAFLRRTGLACNFHTQVLIIGHVGDYLSHTGMNGIPVGSRHINGIAHLGGEFFYYHTVRAHDLVKQG